MRELANLTITGTVVADPQISGRADNPDRVVIRVISNKRWYDNAQDKWVDGDPYAINVVCWRKLARGVANTIHKGDPVVAIGRMSERSFDGADGHRRWRTELVADVVAVDLRHGIAGRYTRFTKLDGLVQREQADDSSDIADDSADESSFEAEPSSGFTSNPDAIFESTDTQLTSA